MSTHNLEELLVTQLVKHHLLTASQLVEHLAMDGKPFNKTSVYRALDRLLASGQLCEHYFNAAQGLVYELRSHHHDHVACEHCGQVWVSEASGGNVTTSSPPTGFAITHHHLILFGLCEQCQHRVTKTTKRLAAQ